MAQKVETDYFLKQDIIQILKDSDDEPAAVVDLILEEVAEFVNENYTPKQS